MSSEKIENFSDKDIKEGILEEAKSFEKSPWVFLIRRSRLTYLIIVFLLISGIFTIARISRELNPEVEIPIAVVVSAFPGASPLDVEELVTKEIEAEIEELSGVKRIDSTSSLGVSSTIVEFEAGENLEDSIRKLKDAVAFAKSELPNDATEPRVIEISIDDQSILVATLSSDKYDVADLKVFAEDLRDNLKTIPFVSDVRVVGGRERTVRIDVDQQKVSDFGLSLGGIVSSIEVNNSDFPLGSLEVDDLKYGSRIVGEFSSAQELALLSVGRINGKNILLEDVAEVTNDFSKELSRSRLSVSGGEPREAVSIQVFKKTGGDIKDVVNEARKRIEESKGTLYPEDVNAEITRDFSEFIDESISTLSGNGLGTVIIILILLFFFLGSREALIAGLAVPFSFFVSFIVMALIGETLNFLSLFSLVLALGLLVDSAVVIVEGMYNKISEFRITGYWAAISTIKEYAAPLLSGMLTTVAAFLPLLFVQGIFGQFIRTIPVVVSSTLIAALFVSLTIVPSIGALLMKPRSEEERRKTILSRISEKFMGKKGEFFRSKPRSERIASRIFTSISDKYYNFLPKILRFSKIRKAIILSLVGLFAVSIALPISGALQVQTFTEEDSDFFFVEVELPKGTGLEKTDSIIRRVEDILREEGQIVNFVSNAGSGFSLDFTSQQSGSGNTEQGFIEVNLLKKENREETSIEIAKRVRERLNSEIAGATVRVTEAESGPPAGEAVEVRIVGEDLLVLEQAAEGIKRNLENIPTTINVQTSVEFSSGDIVFTPDKDIISDKGFTILGLGLELRKGISRDNDIDISPDGDDIQIDLGYGDDTLSNISDFKNLTVKSQEGEIFHLSELGEVSLEPALASINRRDGERVVSITAGTEGGNPTEITLQIENKIEESGLPEGVRVLFGGEREELMAVFQDMFFKMIIGIILILFILVTQFNSYKQVLIILFTIPLAMIGVFFGMTAASLVLDIPSFIGIVSLTGIVINNAIILIDQINKEREKGHDPVRAAQNAGYVRLRPIILTTITTVFGLLPLSITQPTWQNMGFAIIFGLAFSTLLTLFIVPLMYVSFYRNQIRT